MTHYSQILVAHDLPLVGEAALNTILPIFAFYGHSTVNYPTFLITSTPNLDPQTPTIHTPESALHGIDGRAHLYPKLNAIYTGMFSDTSQIQNLKKLHASYPKSTLYVDPIIGDRGKTYTLPYNAQKELKQLVTLANVVFPNPTEAALLLDLSPVELGVNQHDGTLEIHKAKQLYRQLTARYPSPDIIMTSVVNEAENTIGALSKGAADDDYFFAADTKNPGAFTGTGDILASIVIALWERHQPHTINDKNQLIQQAVTILSQSLQDTKLTLHQRPVTAAMKYMSL